MAPPKRPWFRFYSEAIHDPKLRRLPVAQRWLWVTVLALARQSPLPGYLLLACDSEASEPITETDFADAAGIRLTEVRSGLAAFRKLGMIAEDPQVKALFVVKWNERQFDSDVSTARTRKHRARTDDGPSDDDPGNDDGTFHERSRERSQDPLRTSPSRALATESESESEKIKTSLCDADADDIGEADVLGSDDADAPPRREFSEEVWSLTRLLGQRVKRNGHKVPEPDSQGLERWLDAIDKLLRIDGIDPREAHTVIIWATDDEFWCANIRSANKLRKQYSQLRLRMLNQPQKRYEGAAGGGGLVT